LSVLNIENFPEVEAYLDVRDDQGTFVTGLQAGNLMVFENNTEIPLSDLEELRNGVQVVFALNFGNSFAIRDGQGNSRFYYVSQTLQNWANTLPKDVDDLSLVTPAGVPASHRSDPAEWSAALQALDPDLRSATPSLDTLARAIDLASNPTLRPGMGKVVFFITPGLENEFADSLQNLASQATQTGVHIYVWVIDSQAIFQDDKAAILQGLASQTGGQLFLFSGIETFPDINTLLEPHRFIYRLTYQSQVNVAGQHQVAIRVTDDESDLFTPPQTFDLQLMPPNPVFVSPQDEVVRMAPEDTLVEPVNYLPLRQTIEMLVEFPDEIERQIVRATLYANGEVVAQNIEGPLDQLNWDISQYTSSQLVLLRIEIEDELGLIGTSVEYPIQITVAEPELGFRMIMARYGTVIVGAIVGLTGAILLLILILSGRIRPRSIGARRKGKTGYADPVTRPVGTSSDTGPHQDPVTKPAGIGRKSRPRTVYDDPDSRPRDGEEKKPPSYVDPVTQPVKAVDTSLDESPSPVSRLVKRFSPTSLRWSQRKRAPEPSAYLSRLKENGGAQSEGAIAVFDEITFGSDSTQVSLVLNDPSVEALHARLWRDEEKYFLADANSTAGTWINYAPVSPEGGQLENGDLIHIGRAGFRFSLDDPSKASSPVVIREEQGE
jgi:hypothetical protein